MAGNIVARYSSIRKAAAAIGKNSPSGLAKYYERVGKSMRDIYGSMKTINRGLVNGTFGEPTPLIRLCNSM